MILGHEKNQKTSLVLFIQFLNDQMLRNNDVDLARATSAEASVEFSNLLKISLLMDVARLVVPTIDTVQSPLFSQFNRCDEFKLYLQTSRVIFAGSAGSADSWLPNKRRHFDRLKKYPEYFERNLVARLESLEPFFQKRLRSSTRDVARGWTKHLRRIFSTDDLTGIEQQVRESLSALDIWRRSSFEDRLLMAPSRLDGQALIWDILKQENALEMPASYYDEIEEEFQFLLSFIWIGSHCDEYAAKILYNIPYLGRMDCGFANDNPDCAIDYQHAKANLQRLGLYKIIVSLNADQVAVLAITEQWQFFSSALSIWDRLSAIEGRLLERLLANFEDIQGTRAPAFLQRTIDGLDRACYWIQAARAKSEALSLPHSEFHLRKDAMQFDVCVFLPKFEEWSAFVEVFSGSEARDSVFDDFPNTKVVQFGSKSILIVQAGKTLEAMAAATATILDRTKPKIAILGGICGARNDFRLGDVLVANYVAHLAHGVAREGKFTRRPNNDASVSMRLHEHAEYISSQAKWQLQSPSVKSPLENAPTDLGDVPRAVCEILFGSSNVLLDDTDATLAQEMLAAVPEAKAVEMEAAGLIQSLRRLSDTTEWIMIRGVSDLPLKRNATSRPLLGPDVRAAVTHFASINCAKFCRALLEVL